MLNQDWGRAAIQRLAEGMNTHTQAKDQSLADDPSRTNASLVEALVEQAVTGLYHPCRDKIQEQDQRIKVLSQCIAREVEENQVLQEKVESLENDRQSLLKTLAEFANQLSSWHYCSVIWGLLPSRLRKEWSSLLHPCLKPFVPPLEDGLERTQKKKQIPDTIASNAGRPKMKIRSVDQLLQAWQETGTVSTL